MADDTPTAVREFTFREPDFNRVCRTIYARAGISLGEGKRHMVYSRLSKRLRALGFKRFSDYLDHLDAEPDVPEWEHFTNALTTNLTSFFREAHHFDQLRDWLRARPAGRSIEIWCAAASTGEEPYSIAITAIEAFGRPNPPVRVLATDLDTRVLETAERGVYPVEALAKMPPERTRQFFQRGQGPMSGWARIKPELRALVSFRPLNLLAPDWPIRGPIDAIFCRNVMIYFDKETQYSILNRFLPLLSPDGLLFAGHSESFFHAADLFRGIGRSVYRPVAERSEVAA